MDESSFESAKEIKITEEQAIEALRKKGVDSNSQALFEQWVDQSQGEIDKIYEMNGSEATAIASIRWSIRRAVVYYKAGYSAEAIADLEQTCDAAGSKVFGGLGLYEEASGLLSRMRLGQSVS